jgi:hypothetical protein
MQGLCRAILVASAAISAQSYQPAAAQSTAATAPIPPEYNIPAVRAAREACIADINRLCPDVVPGGGRIIRCLAAQRDQMSPGCKTAVQVARAALGF